MFLLQAGEGFDIVSWWHETEFGRLVVVLLILAVGWMVAYTIRRFLVFIKGVKVEKLNDTMFKVTLRGDTTTTHNVTVPPEYSQQLTSGLVSSEILVEKSFEFLLERERNTSIPRSFELPVIQRQFPEYEKTVRGMLENQLRNY